MITIENVKKKSEAYKGEISFCDYLLHVVKYMPQQGITKESIRLEIKIMDSLEKQKMESQLSIEDSHIQYLQNKSNGMGWILREMWIVEFTETLENIKL
jgi:hypothetical protein